MSEADILDAIENAEDGSPLTLDEEFELKCAKFLRNDVGNAQRLRERFGKDLMWVREVGWFAWTGKHWSRDDGDRLAHIFAHRTAQGIWRECAALEKAAPDFDLDDEEQKAAAKTWGNNIVSHKKWARGAGNSGRLKSMLAEAQPYLMKDIEDLDPDPFLFNVQNGTLDLREVDPLREHRRDDLITRISPAPFEPENGHPHFLTFLNRIIPDSATQVFLQRYIGYCMTGSVAEQVLLLCYGEGANGKSTLCDIISHLLGDYAMNIHFSSLLHNDRRGGSDATPDIARLPGARFVMASEPEMGAKFSESTIKQLTGADNVTARHLNRDFFEFKPQFKLLLAANHKPQVRGQDDGIWRRLLLIPFKQKIPLEERDRDLTAKLKAEGAGILNWMMDGARLWLERGLEVPDVIRTAVDDYRSESDPVGMFLEACTVKDEEGEVKARDIYGAYVVWCKDNALDPYRQSGFGKALTNKGYGSTKRGIKYRLGLSLLPEREWRDLDAEYDEVHGL